MVLRLTPNVLIKICSIYANLYVTVCIKLQVQVCTIYRAVVIVLAMIVLKKVFSFFLYFSEFSCFLFVCLGLFSKLLWPLNVIKCTDFPCYCICPYKGYLNLHQTATTYMYYKAPHTYADFFFFFYPSYLSTLH